MRLFVLSCCLLFLSFSAKGVKDSVMFRNRDSRIRFGYSNRLGRSDMFEIGLMTSNLFHNKPMLIRHESDNNGIFISNKNYYTLGVEIDFRHNIKGGYIGYTSGGIVAYGANLNYFNEKYKYDFFGIKPMVGCVYKNFQLFYGYNFKLYGNSIEYVPTHSLYIAYFLPLKIKEKKERKEPESKFIKRISKPFKWVDKWIKSF